MSSSFVERKVEDAVQEALNDRAVRFLKSIRKAAAKQGGENTLENYQLLGKRTLIVLGVAIVAAQAAGAAISFAVSRKTEEQRIERVVRRVLEEEREKEEA